MTSKEDLKMIKIKCHPNANPNPMIDEALNNIEKDLEVLKILRPFLKEVLEINENGTIVYFKSVKYYNGYVVDINGDWNETEQIKKNKKLKEWLDGKD